MSKQRKSNKDYLRTFGPATALTLIGFVIAYQFVGPPPPETFCIASGAKSGAYFAFAGKYGEYIAREKIRLEVVETSGSQDNLARLKDPHADIQVALIQGGLLDSVKELFESAEENDLISLASLYYEPLWIFCRRAMPVNRLSDFKGKRLAVGLEDSGTRSLALRLLKENGVEESTADFRSVGDEKAADLLLKDELDAMFAVTSVESPIIKKLLNEKGATLFSVERAEAYTRRFPYLAHVTLPQGVMDLEGNIPNHDVKLLAPVATLVARKDFHPALIDLLLQAADRVHGSSGIFETKDEFPSPRFVEFPLSEDAERYFKHGPPFLQRFLPFWLATLVDRLKVMLLPIVFLLIPLFKVIPPLFKWKSRRKILQWYKKLLALEARLDEEKGAEQLSAFESEVKEIEQRVTRLSVPLGYADNLYDLRLHIRLIQDKINRLKNHLR